ncbi:MAG: O-antigen ligase family protein [Patescibacteria group bacterium]
MNSKSLTSYYVLGIKALMFVIPFLSFWISKSMFFPYISGRNFAFRILVEIALALWLGLIFLNKEYRPKFTPILLAILAFVAVIGLADAFGVDPAHSFWSRLERMEGYMMVLHLAAYFLVLTSVFRTKKEWLQFFNLFVIAGILVGSYGVLQVLGLKEAIQGGNFRIDGTIGNPTYLAAYLTLVITLALVLMVNVASRAGKYFYGAVIIFNLIIMFFTATRGVTLALVLAVPLFLILYLFFDRTPGEQRFRKIVLWVLVAAILLPVGLWLIRGTSLVQNNPVLSRLTSISLGERTIKSRFAIWGLSWQAFKERPILGWGQENFLYAFSKYYNPKLYDQEPWFDRPHNIIFEWLLNGGILGLLAYLSLFATLIWSLIQLAIRKLLGIKEALILMVATGAYLFQNFFVFDNFNTYVIFFALLAYVNRLSEGFLPEGLIKIKDLNVPESQKASKIIFGAGLVLVIGLIYSANLRPIAQSRGIIAALKATASQSDPITATLEEFHKALEINTFANTETLEQLARVTGLLIGNGNFSLEVKKNFVEYTTDKIEDFLEKHNQQIRLHLMVANLYQSARSYDPSYFGKARYHLEFARSLSPNKQQILFLLADNYLLTNDIDKALEALKTAVDLEPSYRDAQLNYATLAIFMQRNDIVQQVIKNLNDIRLNSVDIKLPHAHLWNFINDLKRLFDVYMRAGQPQNARAIYDFTLKLKSDVEKYGIEIAYGGVVQAMKDALTE